MKKLILLISIISISQLCTGQIAPDKQLHFIGGAFIAGATNAIVYDQTRNKTKAFIWGVAVASAVGLGKELLDESRYNGFDGKDLGTTILGAFTISITLNILEK